jgi:hypothetical protein
VGGLSIPAKFGKSRWLSMSMSEKIASAVISRRRALSLMGLAALSLAVPPTVLMVSDAEAQQTTPPSAPETGTERRQERRTRRVKRRVHRSAARKKGRMERRELRRTGGEEKKY